MSSCIDIGYIAMKVQKIANLSFQFVNSEHSLVTDGVFSGISYGA